jgi:transcriptional regulator with XRE-family HTH domain
MLIGAMPEPRSPSRLGDFIRRQRELNDVTMRQFARMSGISNPYLSQIERGLREPSEKVVDAIAQSFDMTADTLYRQAGVRSPEEEAPESDVRSAIEADDALTARQRRALLELYDACLEANGYPRAGRRQRSST